MKQLDLFFDVLPLLSLAVGGCVAFSIGSICAEGVIVSIDLWSGCFFTVNVQLIVRVYGRNYCIDADRVIYA